MDKQEVQKLIEEAIKYKTETNSVEFKDARGGLPKSTWKSISAFSHKPGGGIIVFGIIEDRDKREIEIIGTEALDNLQEKIGDLVENKTITAKKCEEIISDTPRQTINYDLSKMQKMGLLHSVGESKSTYYEANF